MAVQIPHRIHPEVSKANALRGDQKGTGRSIPPVSRPQGTLDRRGAHYAGSWPYAAERAAETGGVECGGIYQRQKCNPYREALYEAGEKLRRPGVLDAGIFVDTVGRDTELIRRYIAEQEKEDRRFDQLEMPWIEGKTNTNQKN